jgi:putative acetyltransferase
LINRVEFAPAGGEARRDVLALAPLAVLPAHWDRGIGTELTRTALEIADQRDEPFVAVLGAPSFFARFGFTPAADDGIESPYDAAGPSFQVRLLAAASFEPGTVVYPPMFGEI